MFFLLENLNFLNNWSRKFHYIIKKKKKFLATEFSWLFIWFVCRACRRFELWKLYSLIIIMDWTFRFSGKKPFIKKIFIISVMLNYHSCLFLVRDFSEEEGWINSIILIFLYTLSGNKIFDDYVLVLPNLNTRCVKSLKTHIFFFDIVLNFCSYWSSFNSLE